MTWRLTADAELDLDEMVTFGARQYGLANDMDYYDRMVEVFVMLVEFPGQNSSREIKGRQVQLHVYLAHHILYTIDDGDVLILRVLHGSANWIDHL